MQESEQGQAQGATKPCPARRPVGQPAAGFHSQAVQHTGHPLLSHIAFEDLYITGLARGMLAKSVFSAASGQLIHSGQT
jgi:hypothetical protein